MNYQQTLDYMFSKLPMFQREGKAAYKADLNNTLALDKHLEHPHRKFRSIHIAGTNGKGSVAHILASILQTSGYKVGLYTSPHLKDFRERLRVNGEKISEKAVVEFVEKNKKIIEKIKPSFFEITVAMAFDYFAGQNTDIAVVEVGLGGRLDSTNIITPLLSIITNIGIDHTEFLGHSLEEIAYEKASIIKKNVPVIIGEKQAQIKQIFIEKSQKEKASVYFADDIYSSAHSLLTTENKQCLNIFKNGKLLYKNLKTDLLGMYQKKNIITSLQAVDILKEQGINIKNENIYEGIENVTERTGLLGRWQILNRNPLIICDTGHNEDGIAQVIKQIEATPYKHLHIVFGVVNDKNIDAILELLPKNASYYFTRANIPRALDENVLAKKASLSGLQGKTYPTVKEALDYAKANAKTNDLIFIGGSTFVVAEVL